MTAVLTSLVLAFGLLIHRIFGVSIRNSELVWKELSLLLTRKATYKSGRYYEFYEGEYISQLLALATELERDAFNPFNPNNLKYTRTIREARDTAEDLRLQDMNTLLRRQPFGILIGGEPGTGKSMSAMKMGALVLRLAGVDPSQKNMITLNEGDDFQSEFRSHHKCVIFDDLGASSAMVTGIDPYRKVIDFINNVPRTSLNPHLELKGNVWIEPEVVIATTNLAIPFRSLQSSNMDVVMCPDALTRRFKLMYYQYDYNSYIKVSPHSKILYKEKRLLNEPLLTWSQVEKEITKAYKEHARGQDTYLSLMKEIVPDGVRTDLRPESSGLGWYLVIAFQAVLRFIYYRQVLNGNWNGDAVILLNIRRFLAVPLNQVRSEQRKIIVDRLFEAGFSRRAIAMMVDSRATATRLFSGIIPTAIEIILDVVHGRSYKGKVTGAIAVIGFDALVRRLFSGFESSLVYDMSVLIFGSSLGRLFRYKAEEDGYADRFHDYCCDSVKARTSSWSTALFSSLAFFPPVVTGCTMIRNVGKTLDKIAGAFRPRRYKTEAKKHRYLSEMPKECVFAGRVFRYSTRCVRYERAESFAQPCEVFEPNIAKVIRFDKALGIYAPLRLTTAEYLMAHGAVRFGDVFVSPLLQTTSKTFVYGHEFLIVFDQSTNTMIFVRPCEVPIHKCEKFMKRIIALQRARGLNMALVECKTAYIRISTIRDSLLGEVVKLLKKTEQIQMVSDLLTPRFDREGYLAHRTVVGYRDTKLRLAAVPEEDQNKTDSDDTGENQDRAA